MSSRKAAEGGYPTRRVLADGSELMIYSALTYIPRRRKARHYADSFSRALLIAKDLPAHGAQWAHDLAPYLARELTVAVGAIIGVEIGRPLRWAEASGESAKSIRFQHGHGRKLGRRVEIIQDVEGRRVCIIDDLCTSGITAALTAEALVEAGAKQVSARTLARTERTEDRPDRERRMVAVRGQSKRSGRKTIMAEGGRIDFEQATDGELWARLPARVVADPEINATAVRVYAALLIAGIRAKVRGEPGYQGQEALGEECGEVSVSTVSRAMEALEEAGYITTERVGLGQPDNITIHRLP